MTPEQTCPDAMTSPRESRSHTKSEASVTSHGQWHELYGSGKFFGAKTGVKIEVERITYLPAAKRYMFVPFTKHSSPPGTSFLRHRWKSLEEMVFLLPILRYTSVMVFSPPPGEDGSILTSSIWFQMSWLKPPTRYKGFFFLNSVCFWRYSLRSWK